VFKLQIAKKPSIPGFFDRMDPILSVEADVEDNTDSNS